MAEGSATATRRNESWLRRFWPWFVPPAYLLAVLGLRLVVQAFMMPSGGMYPTLIVSDHIFASTLAYGVFENEVPARADVIIFDRRHSDDDRLERHATRVIALPGDTLLVEDGHPVINGWRVPSCLVTRVNVELSPGVVSELDVFVEFLDGAAYLAAVDQSVDARTQGPYVVSSGEVYVLGDNRDNSADSRTFRLGKGGGVPLDEIVGRVSLIWWSRYLSSRFGLSIHGKPTLPPLEPSPQAALDACLAKRPPVEKTRPPAPKGAR